MVPHSGARRRYGWCGRQTLHIRSFALAVGVLLLSQIAASQQKKPNILVIWGDDIGIHNISAYNLGVMGYKTPNIDRLAKEGALFTDAYAQQSCTAGRSSFILGQHPFRTGPDRKSLTGNDRRSFIKDCMNKANPK